MTLEIKSTLEQYFIDNWTQTQIQFDGVDFDYSNIDSWISLVYTPVENNLIGFDGSSVGRIRNNAILKVFCYAKTVPLTYKLSDDVKAFLNGKQFSDIKVSIGQDRGATNLDNGFFEVLTIFEVNKF